MHRLRRLLLEGCWDTVNCAGLGPKILLGEDAHLLHLIGIKFGSYIQSSISSSGMYQHSTYALCRKDTGLLDLLTVVCQVSVKGSKRWPLIRVGLCDAKLFSDELSSGVSADQRSIYRSANASGP